MPEIARNLEAEPHRLRVELGARAYDIVIGAGILARAGAEIKALANGRVYIVTDANVADQHLRALRHALEAAGLETGWTIAVPPGEHTKCVAELDWLILALLEHGLERSDLIIAFGGGVVGDLAGLAAAIALRGVDFVQIPTTLLAQVDSSVGGKTAIDTVFGKNTIGAFHQPRLVVIDTDLLATLPERERRAGYAELMKHGLIADEAFFSWLETHGAAVLAGDPDFAPEAVYRSCAIKAKIVAADEREAGERALLNLGHTFAHAFEAELGYSSRLLHGEAVSFGCRMAAAMSARLGFCPPSDVLRLERHLDGLGLARRPRDLDLPPLRPSDILRQIRRDKKTKAGRTTFVLLKGIGRAFLTRGVDDEALAAFLQDELT
jgi:3-dehydroquinate synthase